METLERSCLVPGKAEWATLQAAGRAHIKSVDDGPPDRAIMLRTCRFSWSTRGSLVMTTGDGTIEFGLPVIVGFADDRNGIPTMLRFDRFDDRTAAQLIHQSDPLAEGSKRSPWAAVAYSLDQQGLATVTAMVTPFMMIDADEGAGLILSQSEDGFEAHAIGERGTSARIARDDSLQPKQPAD